MSVNLQIILGRVGQEPIIRHIDGGRTVAAFSVATSEKYKNKAGEMIENTEWFNIVCWQGIAEFCDKYVKKGAQIYVEGKTTHTEYTDKDDIKRYKVEVVAHKIDLIDWPDKNPSPNYHAPENRPQNAYQQEPVQPDVMDDDSNVLPEGDDLPF